MAIAVKLTFKALFELLDYYVLAQKYFGSVQSTYYVHTRPIIFQSSCRIALIYKSARSRTIADALCYDWIAEKNLDG